MKIIRLAHGKKTVVDDHIYPLVKDYKWYPHKSSTNNYYARATIKGKKVLLHRLITECKKEFVIDHINGNGLDNRKKNLRMCLQKENMRNQKTNSRNTSGYKGVYYRKDRKKWTAQIRVNKRHKFLGYFDNKIDAAKSYNRASILYHKEFSKLNNVSNF